MTIKFQEVFGVKINARLVRYLSNLFTGEVVAKQCTGCKSYRFLDQFNKSEKGFAGTHSLCRECHKQSNADYREMVSRNESEA